MRDPLDRFRVDWSQDKPPEPPRITPMFFDLATGRCAKHPDGHPLFWWTDGNGSCDCNREAAFNDIGDDDTGVCLGSKRYIAVNMESDDGRLSVAEKDALCAALNESYADAIAAWARDCEWCRATPQHMEHFPCKRRDG